MADLKGKFALVTGGAQGIGLACVREFLNNGIEGVTLIDYNAEKGNESAKLLNDEFGEGKVIFEKVDVSDSQQLKDAFEKSLNHWKNIDIVFNNAGIANENNWKNILMTNSGGTLQGTLLGFEYMSKNKNGRGGVIINTSSSAAVTTIPNLPIYSATKSFILTLSRCLGHPMYFDHTAVKVLTVCPGKTTTEMLISSVEESRVDLCPTNKQMLKEGIDQFATQTPEEFAKNVMIVMKKGNNGSVWYIAKNEASQIDFSTIEQQCIQ